MVKIIYKLGRRFSREIFELPCVCGVGKTRDKNIFYTVDAKDSRGSNAVIARPGDYLCQREDGTWIILTPIFDNDKIKENIGIKVCKSVHGDEFEYEW